jgi:hypothetical protein
MAMPFVYTAIFALTLASGEVIEAEGESYSTQDACLLQSEADAKLMAKEWQWEESRTGRKGFYRGVEVRCERQHGSKGHVGR